MKKEIRKMNGKISAKMDKVKENEVGKREEKNKWNRNLNVSYIIFMLNDIKH